MLTRQLAYHALQLHVKQGGQYLGRIQARKFDKIVNVARLVHAQQSVSRPFRRRQAFLNQSGAFFVGG